MKTTTLLAVSLFFSISAAAQSATGHHPIHPTDLLPRDCAVKATLSCGSTIASAITTSSCYHSFFNIRGEKYSIEAFAGQIIDLEMTTTAFPAQIDASGPGLQTVNSVELSNYVGDGRSTHHLDFYAPRSGVYSVEALSQYGVGDPYPSTGAYTLKVACFAPPVSCVNASTLCLNASRFRVTLLARDQRSGKTGPGVALPANDLFGYFSIPALTNNPDNPEVFVKILDGRGVNGKFWVFYNGLTDLEYTVTVLDTVTGAVRNYRKDPDSACGGFDTAAF